MKFSSNKEVSLTHSKLFYGSFCDVAQGYKYLHPNIEHVTTLYFYNDLSCIFYYLLHINK